MLLLGENYDCFGGLIFICLVNADTLTCVCVLPYLMSIFKASCSNSEKLLYQAEFLMEENSLPPYTHVDYMWNFWVQPPACLLWWRQAFPLYS